jgi:hypothetical protein
MQKVKSYKSNFAEFMDKVEKCLKLPRLTAHGDIDKVQKIKLICLQAWTFLDSFLKKTLFKNQ